MAAEREAPSPAEQVARLYEQTETEAARATERLVGSRGFAGLLGQLAENAAALTRIGNDGMDLVLRNLRLAGRRDVVRLARQLARTEDKLERVLQEIEELRDQLDDARTGGSSDRGTSVGRAASAGRAASVGRAASAGRGTSAGRGARSAGNGRATTARTPSRRGSRSAS